MLGGPDFLMQRKSILRKSRKIGATRCKILRLKCTKFDSVGAPPQTSWVRSPDPIAIFKGPRPTSKGKEKGGEGKEERK